MEDGHNRFLRLREKSRRAGAANNIYLVICVNGIFDATKSVIVGLLLFCGAWKLGADAWALLLDEANSLKDQERRSWVPFQRSKAYCSVEPIG
jgi:hypothetical protein